MTNDQSDKESTNQPSADNQPTPGEPGDQQVDGWELWVKLAMLMAGCAALGWLVVWLRLGKASVFTHAFVLSSLGVLTLPVIFWGLMKTVFNRPVLRRSRTLGFVLLVAVALFCNIPMFAVPLSTEQWTSTHTYRLPFDGEWVVTAGGDSMETNYHATTAAYRWGYDFSRAQDGKRFGGTGEQLDDYYCVGEPVFAPAPGEVVDLEDGHADNQPNSYDAESVLGNHVVLKIDAHEYLFVAHLQRDSIAVHKGQQVGRGAKLGGCGNSGRSLHPHVHVHLQVSDEFPVAEGLPLQFSDYEADGKQVDRGMPAGSADSQAPFGQHVRRAGGSSNER